MGKIERSGRCDGERWLKGGNVMSSICHDFTLLCCDKVMKISDTYLLKVQNVNSIQKNCITV